MIPDSDGSKACDEVLEQYFHLARKGTEVPLVGFDESLERRQEITGLIKKMEQEQKQIDQRIKLYMQENEAARSDKYRVLWANVETSRLDVNRLREERPEIYRTSSKCPLPDGLQSNQHNKRNRRRHKIWELM